MRRSGSDFCRGQVQGPRDMSVVPGCAPPGINQDELSGMQTVCHVHHINLILEFGSEEIERGSHMVNLPELLFPTSESAQ